MAGRMPRRAQKSMLAPEQLTALYDKLSLSAAARSVVEQIRSSPPSRNVQGGRGNVCVRYPSVKMGLTIQAESHTLELPAIYRKEYEDNVLEFYDQPPRIILRWQGRGGRKTGTWHTPDFFVICRDGMWWEEWKYEDELERLAKQQPHRYARDADGRWRCPPGEEYANQYQLGYRVRTSAEIDLVLHQNLVFLEDYLSERSPAPDPEEVARIVRLFRGQSFLMLSDLLQQAGDTGPDLIYAMIARHILICNLDDETLTSCEHVRVFRDVHAATAHRAFKSRQTTHEVVNLEIVFETGTALAWDGKDWEVVNTGVNEVSLKNEDGKVATLSRGDFERCIAEGRIQPIRSIAIRENPADALLRGASKQDLQEANRRSALIEPYLAGQKVQGGDVSARTLFSYLAAYRSAEQTYGNGYVGLLPQHKRKGRRGERLPASVLDLINEVAETKYEDLRSSTPWAVYGKFLELAEQRGIPTTSFKTFLARIRARPRAAQVRKREGDRAAYQVEEFFWLLEQSTPRHGSRPFEIAHIDHTQLEIELVASKSGLNLGRPWLTLMIDAHTRMVIAFCISFEKPSHRACMMVLRDCVRRYGRLPQFVVTDRGAEFLGAYFQTLLAAFRRSQKIRPAAQSRNGSVVERHFGVSQSQLIHNLRGNTKLMRNVRTVTKMVNPKSLAVWTLPDFIGLFDGWLRECYEASLHPALRMTPKQALEDGLRLSGYRKFTLIPYDSMFELLTCPSTRNGRAKVLPSRGIKVNYLHYWNDAFRRPGVVNKRVAVRYDPYNAGVAYAYVEGQWLTCRSEYYHVFNGRTVSEVQRASQELMRGRQVVEKSRSASAARLGQFLLKAEQTEVKSLEQLRDGEHRASHLNPPIAVAAKVDATPSIRIQRRKRKPLQHYQDAGV
ncbi:MAG TPA: DDE-type integrase/transposase/recombinase [Nevskiales bacterium]|nr:DDE-type integrase/transposase/recombinase [Nevskiales bacterium]